MVRLIFGIFFLKDVSGLRPYYDIQITEKYFEIFKKKLNYVYFLIA